MYIQDLDVFLAVIKGGSIKKAASSTNNSTSSGSRAIQRLENFLGVRLFKRGANKVKLNKYGHLLYVEGQVILKAVNDLETKMKNLRSTDEGYQVESCDCIPAWFVKNEISVNLEQEIATSLTNDYNFAIALLKNGDLDFVIMHEPIDVKGLCCEFMACDRLLLTVDASDERFKNTQYISLQDKRIDKVLYYNVEGVFSRKLKRSFTLLAKGIQFMGETDYMTYQMRLKRKGVISLCTSLTASYMEIFKGRKVIPISDYNMYIDYYLVYKESQKEKYKEVLELAKEWAMRYPRDGEN